MADNHIKGVSSASAVTIHADVEFSTAHWETTDDVVITELLRAADLDGEPIEPAVQVQRWRYARPALLHPQRCLVAAGVPTLICAGDAFGGAKVEGAASGPTPPHTPGRAFGTHTFRVPCPRASREGRALMGLASTVEEYEGDSRQRQCGTEFGE